MAYAYADPLSAVDATFLAVEDANAHMHIGSVALFEAVQPPAGEMPIVLAAGESGILLHEAIGHGMEADCNRKDISIYSDMIGRKICNEAVSFLVELIQDIEKKRK